MILYMRISTAALALCSLAAGWQKQPAASAGADSTVIRVGVEDNGKDVDLTSGGTLLVKLKGNASTGYSWAVAGDPAPLKLVKSSYRKGASSSAVGRQGTQVFEFRASSPGLARLTLEYRRPWEYNVPPVQTFRLRIYVR